MKVIQQDKEKKADDTTPIIYESILDKNTMRSKVIPPLEISAIEFFVVILGLFAFFLAFVVAPILLMIAYSDF